ncbi:MAG: hypothetical protein M3O62_05150, partial [Pseudomonadota bacterium]|nr:hypothetical protein [Pseudomonadota bacterium]
GELSVLIWAPLILITLCSVVTLLFLLRPERAAAHTTTANARKEMKAVRAALQIAQIIEAAPTQVTVVATNTPSASARRRSRRALPRRTLSVRGSAPAVAQV